MACFDRAAGKTWHSDGTAPDPVGLASSALACFVEVADCVRDLAPQLGVSPYRALLVHVRWTGGRRGEGTRELVSEVELLPSPRIVDSRNRTTKSGGTRSEGDLSASWISLVYTEDDLLGRGTGGAPIDADTEFFWELVPRCEAGDADRIRCRPGRPRPDFENAQWVVPLTVEHAPRSRAGALP